MAIPKKTLQKISHISVMDDILRDNLKGDYFADSAPDQWTDSEKKLYDMMAEVEYKLIEKVKNILSNPAPKKSNRF